MKVTNILTNVARATILVLSLIGSNCVMAKTAAVIFDCDGVLVDTEYLKFQAWQQALANNGVKITIDDYMPLIGRSSKKIMSQLAKEKSLHVDQTAIIEEKNKIYDKLQLAGVKPIPEAVKFFKNLLANKAKYKIKVGLASSAPQKQIRENLKQIGVDPASLDEIVSGSDDLKYISDPDGTNKPKPYIYNLIANKMNVDPTECIVIEDSDAGVIAGADAGMTVVAVPNHFTDKHDFSKAKAVTSFEDMTFNKLQKIAHHNS